MGKIKPGRFSKPSGFNMVSAVADNLVYHFPIVGRKNSLCIDRTLLAFQL
ncbi:hypothetical protein PJIAN_1159 [Paludibacter jiangxiensis]|uniref:Uncharacterized protein n=1 Tax=Paludibacter jiangxiensis TaxID=681398 RepID=A0A170Y7R3_9BACT|nr:hypothetical protein PJIAN_1159 [Paludibacter jiangxiensis]